MSAISCCAVRVAVSVMGAVLPMGGAIAPHAVAAPTAAPTAALTQSICPAKSELPQAVALSTAKQALPSGLPSTQSQDFFREGIDQIEREIQQLFDAPSTAQEPALVIAPSFDAEYADANASTILDDAAEEPQLSAEQHQELVEINRKLGSHIQDILTPAQFSQLRHAIQGGADLRYVLLSLGLNADQQTALNQAFQSAQAEIVELLTPEQREQLFPGMP